MEMVGVSLDYCSKFLMWIDGELQKVMVTRLFESCDMVELQLIENTKCIELILVTSEEIRKNGVNLTID